MQKAIQAAKIISKNLDEDATHVLEEYNLHTAFDSIYFMGLENKVANTLICAIIYSYDANSNWCDLKKTSFEDKENIFKGLKADMSIEYYQNFIDLTNEDINNAIGDFLDLQPDWRFSQVMRSRDFHSKSLKEKNPDFTGLDNDKVIKAKEALGKYIREGLNHRKICDEYMLQIEKDYVNLNHRTEQDFGTKFTDTELAIDPLSWRDFIKHKLIPMREKSKNGQPN